MRVRHDMQVHPDARDRHALARIVVAAVAFSLALSGCGREFGGVDLSAYVPEDRVDDVHESLVLSGDNSDEILAAIVEAPDTDREALAFVLSGLPPVDLATADSEFLLRNVALAREARERFPWAATVPSDVYLSYVVPPRVSQEPLEDWRPYLIEQLGARLEGFTSMEQAAIEVNRWCGEHVGFKPTQRRDQGVFETLASGFGRCEEMMIVHIAALRSVGIPARQTWTPYWATGDNNHAWTELWVDGEWRYTGACEPRDELDDAWFTDAAENAAIVLSSVFGAPAQSDEVYREEDRFSLVNSVSRYLTPGTLRVRVAEAGRPARDVPVTVSVWNFGALRAVARQETDDAGEVSVTLGDGTYFACAGGPGASDWERFEVVAGEETLLDLELGPETRFDASFRLTYDEPGD